MVEDRIVVLTGAGVSAESGLGTFRDTGGLWDEFDLEEVATPEGFARDPDKVHAFYNMRRANMAGAAPNAAHEALARLCRARPETVLITQNIDGLHEAAGTPRVIHMHGELCQSLCPACDARAPAPLVMQTGTRCSACGHPGLRPDVVWFGEMPYQMDEIEEHLAHATLFAAIGTSGTVYPAAGFGQAAKAQGAICVEISLEPGGAGFFDELIEGPATETVPIWVERLLG